MKYLLAVFAAVTLFASPVLANVEDGSHWRCGLIEVDDAEVEYKPDNKRPGKYLYKIVIHHDGTQQSGAWIPGGVVQTDKNGSTGLRWAPKGKGPDGREFRVRHGRLSYKTIGPDGKVRWYGATKLAPKKGQAL